MRTHEKVAYVGLDCHKNFSRLSARDADGKIVLRQRLDHRDRAALREDLGQFPPGTPAVLEGSFGWGWMCDELEASGLEPHLANSRKTAAHRAARGIAKNNKLDADLLSGLWSENERWWEIWLAPPEVRDRREWLRYRMALVKMQTGLKNRIHATLHRHGIIHGLADLFGKAGRLFLKNLCEASAEKTGLRDSGRQTLSGFLKLLDQIRRQLAAATRLVRRTVSSSEEGERWRSLPGISWVLAYTILAEVGPVSRFAGHRKLCAYALLAPLDDDSGDEDSGAAPLGRHVGHAGRRTLKWAFIEAAHGAVRKNSQFRAIYDRRTDGGKRDKNRGLIAVAHELCRVGFSCCRYGRNYSAERPPRPGTTVVVTGAEAPSPREVQTLEGEITQVPAMAESPVEPTPRPSAKVASCVRPEIPRHRQGRSKKGKESDGKSLNRSKHESSRPGTGGPEDPMVAVALS